MATMYPNTISVDTKSPAERWLFQALKEQLNDDYLVFHQVAWQALNKERKPYDGEADFVIAHAQHGILTLEVKGGSIAFNAATGKWTSTDRGGTIHNIKDPFGQANDSKYKLRHRLEVMIGTRALEINLGHAVAFPDTVVDRALPGMDRPREIVLDMQDKEKLATAIKAVFDYYRGSRPPDKTALGNDGIKAIKKLLGTGFDLPTPLWGEFAAEEKEFIQLTQQQFIILDMLNRYRRALISGFAGSGKTMLAVEKATRLAEREFRVLLTCYNKNLATDIRARMAKAPNPQIDVAHFHSLCTNLLKDANALPPGERNTEFFRKTLPEAVVDNIDKIAVRYDAIIVDEGQDFEDAWWIVLQMLLHDPDNGILYIFYDDNQRIFVREGAFPIAEEPYMLTVNCRNTQTIHQQIVKCYRGSVEPIANGPAGRDIEKIVVGKTENLHRRLMKLLNKLVNEDRIPTEEIVILTPRSEKTSQLWAKSGRSNFSLTDEYPPSKNQIYCATIRSFKGLERSVVILAELETWHERLADLDHMIYVACSRARNHLIVMLPEEGNEKVLGLFA